MHGYNKIENGYYIGGFKYNHKPPKNLLDIMDRLRGLNELDFEPTICEDPWFSKRTMLKIMGIKVGRPTETCVRVDLKKGALELFPQADGHIKIMCFCCFKGNANRGTYKLERLYKAMIMLKDHVCPPWPGFGDQHKGRPQGRKNKLRVES